MSRPLRSRFGTGRSLFPGLLDLAGRFAAVALLVAVVAFLSALAVLGPGMLGAWNRAPVAAPPALSEPVPAVEPAPAGAPPAVPAPAEAVELENGLPVIVAGPAREAGGAAKPAPPAPRPAPQPSAPVIPTAPVQRSRPAPLEPVPSPAQPEATVRAVPRGSTPATVPALPPGAPPFARELRLAPSGSRMNGEDVRRMQLRLMAVAGEDPSLGGDGWFGPRTERGVREFQARNGLPVTGVVDRATWARLFSDQAKGP